MDLKYKKDNRSGAIINKDGKGYNEYLNARNRAIEQETNQKRINRLEHDISQIKGMLKQILEK
ncbi:MAG: hypothetical protein HON83_02965 [Candidatus Marinimicrobia bacterium]|jgi:hypothetical protein|nr:hypothetical protein [Candidatus Neomarinimicrobiota bacterium]